jgi:predicted phosphodiesterase
MKMRIVALSDTHGWHRQVTVPPGDVIIHAGDLTRHGDANGLKGFFAWYSSLPFRHRLCVAGNHDAIFEREPAIAAQLVPAGVTYLQDSGCEIDGVRFWGSPVQPTFLNWSFNRSRGLEIDQHWQQIPPGTDVIITHGPCHGKLDLVSGEHVGCEMLRSRLEILKPSLHICGHIHGASGVDGLGSTTLVNAAICTEAYWPINPPIVLDLEDGVAVVRGGADQFP